MRGVGTTGRLERERETESVCVCVKTTGTSLYRWPVAGLRRALPAGSHWLARNLRTASSAAPSVKAGQPSAWGCHDDPNRGGGSSSNAPRGLRPPCSPPCCCPLLRPAASVHRSGCLPALAGPLWLLARPRGRDRRSIAPRGLRLLSRLRLSHLRPAVRPAVRPAAVRCGALQRPGQRPGQIHRSGLPARTGPAAQPSCRLHRQRTMPARAALLKSAGCLAKNDRHEPVSMAGRWAPPGAVQAAFAPPAAVCQGRPALWLGLVGAAMTAATSRWRGAALQCSTRACFGSGRGSGSATSDQCPACWSTIRGH
jgi:hypothetical protein